MASATARGDRPSAGNRAKAAAHSSAGLTPLQTQERSILLADDRRSTYRASKVLLDRFDVFCADALDHRSGRIRVSQPSLSALPLTILAWATGQRKDVHHLREVQIARLPTVWVLADAQGICMHAGMGGGCTVYLRGALSGGMSINVHLSDGCRDVVGVVPDTKPTIRVRTPSWHYPCHTRDRRRLRRARRRTPHLYPGPLAH